MTINEFLSKFTGFSIPIVGVSWNPSEAEITVARRVVAFLEDRRVLYIPTGPVVEKNCLESVSRIREYLTDEIGKVAGPNPLSASLRTMRAACRNFLEATEQPGVAFAKELAELRRIFGMQIAQLVVRHRLEVEDGLEPILRLAETSPNDASQPS